MATRTFKPGSKVKQYLALYFSESILDLICTSLDSL